MKKSILLLNVLFFAAISAMAQNQAPSPSNLPVLSKPYQAVNIPFQQYLQQNYQAQITLKNWANNGQNTGVTRSTGTGSVNVYRELAYRHDIWSNTADDWSNIDSTDYDYTKSGMVTNYNNMLFGQNSWNNFVTIGYAYNGSGSELSSTNKNWDATSASWVNISKTGYGYDGKGDCSGVTSNIWNTQSAQWLQTYKFFYSYDSTGNKTGELYETWDSTSGNWIYDFNYIYTYNSLGQVITFVNQIWTGDSAWSNSQKLLYTYSAHGDVTEKTTQIWANGNWVNYDQVNCSFDGSNRLIETASLLWATDNNQWVNSSKTDYSYDWNHNNNFEIGCIWNSNTYQWDSSTYKAFTYNADNNPLGEDDAVFINKVFTYTQKYTNFYTGTDKTFTINCTWDKAGNTWDKASMVSYSYDANHNPIYQLNQSWSTAIANFQNQEQYYFYYAPFSTSAISETTNDLGAAIYPNPSSSAQFNLQLNTKDNSELIITIYDALGRMVSSEIQSVSAGENRIPLHSGISSGNYLVHIYDPKAAKTTVLKYVKL